MSPRTRSRAPLVLTLTLAVCVLAAFVAPGRAGPPGNVPATTWHVDASSPTGGDGSAAAPFQDMQSAFDVALDGDTVLVRAGLYDGPRNRGFNTESRSLTVRGAEGAASTVIDCEHVEPFLKVTGFVQSLVVLEGLTVRRGLAPGIPFYAGGGLWINAEAEVEVRGCVFRECLSVSAGAAIWSHNAPVRIERSIFVDNHTLPFGFGTQLGGGALHLRPLSSVLDCDFIENSSSAGGAIRSPIPGGFVLISHCRFRGNSATFRGGAVAGSARLDHCLFVGNRAGLEGGALDAGGELLITSSTLVGNSALRAGGGLSGRDLQVRNSILVRNAAPAGRQIATTGAGGVTVRHCDVEGGAAGVLLHPFSMLDWGAGNIDLPPGFVDPLGPDGDALTFHDNDYRLGPGSPCVDAGDNALVAPDLLDLDGDGDVMEPVPFDLDGNPRFRDDPQVPDTGSGTPPLVDMGAYERQP